jgi:hypothetical protein
MRPRSLFSPTSAFADTVRAGPTSVGRAAFFAGSNTAANVDCTTITP